MLPPVQEVGSRRRRQHRENRLSSRLTGAGYAPAAIVERFVSSRSNTTLISHSDCPGGGQVWVEGSLSGTCTHHDDANHVNGITMPWKRFDGWWQPQGLRLVDIADPFVPREVGHFLPNPAGAPFLR